MCIRDSTIPARYASFSYSSLVSGFSAFCAGAAGFGAPAVAGFLGASFLSLIHIYFFKRMKNEHERFWNKERLAQATAIGMTPEEVRTLASIVEEETNNNEEKPMVAGLYINRLHQDLSLIHICFTKVALCHTFKFFSASTISWKILFPTEGSNNTALTQPVFRESSPP